MSSAHERDLNRARQKRFRKKHAAEIRLKRSLAVNQDANAGGRKPTFRCYEIVDDEGVPLRVFVARFDCEPQRASGERFSQAWLPAGMMSKKAAEGLVRLRRAIIAEWSL